MRGKESGRKTEKSRDDTWAFGFSGGEILGEHRPHSTPPCRPELTGKLTPDTSRQNVVRFRRRSSRQGRRRGSGLRLTGSWLLGVVVIRIDW